MIEKDGRTKPGGYIPSSKKNPHKEELKPVNVPK